uniref:ABC transporter ATP-binding protein n=1 Tax=Thermofilum pendens TaxID=2269 RepID=A0A7J3X595_THEPE
MSSVAGSLLAVKDLHTYIAGFHILQGVSFEVEEGSVTVVLGRNGVGKTTTLKTIMGIYRPARGEVIFRGENIAGLPPYTIASKGISFVPSERNIFTTLAVEENLRLAYNGPRGKLGDRLEMVYSLFPELKRFSTLKAGELSGGQQRMLALACGMVREHTLLILDEPSEGLSPVYVKMFFKKLREFKEEHGKTVLLVEQNFALAREAMDYVYLMDKGVVVAGFPAEKVEASRDLIRRVLGVSL